MIPGSAEQKELISDADEPLATSPPLELRRPASGPLRPTSAVPHSLQSPQDRATGKYTLNKDKPKHLFDQPLSCPDSPQVAQVYVHGSRLPLYDANGRQIIAGSAVAAASPPPAHRPVATGTYSGPVPAGIVAAGPGAGNIVVQQQQQQPQPQQQPPIQPQQLLIQPLGLPPSSVVMPTNMHPNKIQLEIQRERELLQKREREKELRLATPGHAAMPNHGSLVPVMAGPPTSGRTIHLSEPPHASQVPPQAESLLMLLQRYPVMWQGLLALKTDQAAVQMHFVFGNPRVASGSLPCNTDGSTPPLRIVQRMRLEQTQLEGVARKMQVCVAILGAWIVHIETNLNFTLVVLQTVNEHCMLLALPCGRDHMDVLQQSTNLQTGFITYLQQKQAAGIINIPAPGTDQAAYVVHIFPSCEFANENLARIAPDLLHRVADIAHLVIVIATV